MVVIVLKIDKTLVGIRIMLKRREQGLSQEELAEKIGFSKNHLSSIERGKNNLTTNFISKICNVLGETPDYYLIGGSTDITDEIYELIKSLPENHQRMIKKIIQTYISEIPNIN